MNKFFCTLFALFLFISAKSQPTDSLKIKYSAYIDFYYAYDFNQPDATFRQPFLVSYNRHNEMRLNIASVSAELSKSRFRSKFTLQTGTFASDNYANEPSKYLGIIQEANVGFALNEAKSTWVDVGVIPSHLGYEGVVGQDNFTVSRSLSSELSPYFLSGAKITHLHKNWTIAGIIFNSWNSVFDYKKGQYPSFGTQIIKRRNAKTTVNWNTFLGSGVRKGFDQLRFFNNFFINWQASEKVQIIAGLDLGYQKKAKEEGYNSWFSPSLVMRRKITRDFSISGRAELFFDEYEVVTSSVNGHAFDVFGLSANLDYVFTENGLLRLEGRYFSSSGNYFYTTNSISDKNSFIILAMTKKF